MCRSSSFRYILNYVNFLQLLHLYHNFPCDALHSFSVNLTTKGLKRLLGAKSNQKRPITLDLLCRFRSLLDTSIPPHAAIWRLFLLPFFSFYASLILRLPQCTPLTPETPYTERHQVYLPGRIPPHSLVKDIAAPSWYSHCPIAIHPWFRPMLHYCHSSLLQ